MCAYRRLMERIQTRDAEGNLHVILVHQDFDEVATAHGVCIRPGAQLFETDGRLKINWLNERQFEIDSTGEILNRIPPTPTK